MLVLFVPAVGGGIAFLLLPWFDLDGPSQAFVGMVAAQMWILLIGLQVGLWTLALLPIGRAHDAIGSDGKANGRGTARLAAPTVVFAILFAIPAVLPPPDTPLALHRLKVVLLSLAAGAVAVYGVVGIFRIEAALRREFADDEVTEQKIRRFLTLRGWLQTLLRILGAMVGLAVVASGALRNAVLDLPGADPSSFPAEFVWVYGAYYALLLALVYVPTYLQLVTVGEHMRGRLNPFPSRPTVESLSVFDDNARAVGRVLGLEAGAWETVRTMVAILAPLLGALFSLLLGGG